MAYSTDFVYLGAYLTIAKHKIKDKKINSLSIFIMKK